MENKCPDVENYLFIIRQLLDNEASREDEEFLMNHIGKCSCCLNEYELEQQVRTLIKTRLEKKSVPEDLTRAIRKILRSNLNGK